jgi:hypothetical protein
VAPLVEFAVAIARLRSLTQAGVIGVAVHHS